LNGVHNVLITGASAQVAFDPLANLGFSRPIVSFEQLSRRHDHSGGAKSTLKPVAFPEAFLNGMEFVVFSKALDRLDFRSIRLNGQNRTRFNCLAIHHDRAGATDARLASDVRACQPDSISQVMDKERARFDIVTVTLPVDSDFYFHGLYLLKLICVAQCLKVLDRQDSRIANKLSQ